MITTAGKLEQLQSTIETVIHGKSDVVELALVTLLAGGHLLIEDVPGVGKTTLAQTLARSFDCSFQRIQFTSDMLPSDIVGLEVFNQRTSTFEFKSGPSLPTWCSPMRSSARLPRPIGAARSEAEGRNVDQATFSCTSFIVLATHNPSASRNYRSRIAARRFMMRLRMGYPDSEDEKTILREQTLNSAVDRVVPVMHSDGVLALQHEVREVTVDESLIDYLIRIVRATRDADILDLGVSPRGSLALYHAAQALAFVEGRDFVIPDDIKRLVVPIFAHRIVVNSRYSTGLRRSEEAQAALLEILKTVNVPL